MITQSQHIEEAAKAIFDLMPYDGPLGTQRPAWVPHGDSLKQDEARRYASAALGMTPSPQADGMGTVAAFEAAYPELYYHIAKGKICAGEQLYGAIITTMGTTEIGHGESNISADDALRIAIENAGLTLATEGKDWLEENDPQDDTDCVTPFDRYLCEGDE